ncbi:phage holin family protein [Glacieibacterium frigidum]|nr:phage holin family protein [Glacieibacterium frigidum]
MATQPTDGASIGDLLRSLIGDIQHLLRTELRLFQTEVRSNIAGLKTGMILLAAGGTLMLASLITLFAAFVGWLIPVVGHGWAELIVSVASAVIGFILLGTGSKKLGAAGLTPDRTIASLKQDAETLKGN